MLLLDASALEATSGGNGPLAEAFLNHAVSQYAAPQVSDRMASGWIRWAALGGAGDGRHCVPAAKAAIHPQRSMSVLRLVGGPMSDTRRDIKLAALALCALLAAGQVLVWTRLQSVRACGLICAHPHPRTGLQWCWCMDATWVELRKIRLACAGS